MDMGEDVFGSRSEAQLEHDDWEYAKEAFEKYGHLAPPDLYEAMKQSMQAPVPPPFFVQGDVP